jgi:hypothetical protein
MTAFLRHRKAFYRTSFGDWLTKWAHLTVTKTSTLTPREDMMETAVASGCQVHVWSRPKDTCNVDGIHPFFTGDPID